MREFGMEGYGFYWIICETVAQQGDDFQIKKDKEWKTALAISSNFEQEKTEKILNRFADLNLIDKKSFIRGHLYLPKMEDYSDEYRDKVRRKSRHTRDKVGLEGEGDKKEKEIRTEGEGEKTITPSEKMKDFIANPETQEKTIALLKENGLSDEAARAQIRKFISYWTEPSKSGTKQKWEIQETFDVGRRLSTWFSNMDKFSGGSGVKNKVFSV